MAAAPSFVPDAHEVVALKNELRIQYKDQDDQITTTRAVRQMKDPVIVPDKYVDTEVRDPALSDEGFQVAATLSVNPIKIHIPVPMGAPEKQEKNAILRQDWTEAMFEACGRAAMPGMDTRNRIVDMCVNDGGVWGKFLFTKDTWEERYRRRGAKEDLTAYDSRTEKAKRDAGPPFYFGAIDPLIVYPTYDGTKLSSVLEVQERPLYSTFRKYGLTINNGKIVPGQIGQAEYKVIGASKIDFIEYTDDEYCQYVVGGQGYEPYAAQAPWKHGYKRVPYFPAFGLMMGHWTNRKVGWGVGETKRWLVQFSSFLQTMLANVAARDTFTPVIHYLADNAAPMLGRDGSPKTKEEFVAGLREILIAQPGEKWESYPVHEVAEAMKMLLALNNEKIEKLMTPRINTQMGTGDAGAGYAINTEIAESKVRFHPFVSSIEQMYVEMTRFAWWLVEHKIKEPVPVYSAARNDYLVLDKADLQDAVPLTCELDPERPEAKLLEEQYHEKAVMAEFESKDQARAAMGKRPMEVREGLTEDRIRSKPWFQAHEEQEVAFAMGMGQLLLLAQQAQQVAADGSPPGVPPGQMPPGVPPAQQPPQPPEAGGGTPGPVTGAPQAQMPPQRSMAPLMQT